MDEEGRDDEIAGESSLVVGAREVANPGRCPDLVGARYAF